MSYTREIISPNCFCNLCRKPIAKGEKAAVFDTRIAGKYAQIHLHFNCVVNLAVETGLAKRILREAREGMENHESN